MVVSSYRPFLGDLPLRRRLESQAQLSPLPLSSSHHLFLPYILPFYYKLYSQHPGSRVVCWFGNLPMLVITKADDARCVLASDVKHMQRPVGSRRVFHRLMGHGLILAEGEDWHLQRSILRPAFFLEKLKGMVKDMATSALNMIHLWETHVSKGGHMEAVEVEVAQDLKNVAADILSHTMFGTSYVKGKSVFERQERLLQLITKNSLQLAAIPFFKYLPTSENRKMWAMDKQNNEELSEIIDLRKTTAVNTNTDTNSNFPYGTDLLGYVLSAMEEEGKLGKRGPRLTIQQVVDECKTFFFAGHETTAHLLAWTMVQLSLHQDWQEKARQEVFEVCGKQGTPKADDLNKLKLVGMILNETLRLYPILPELGRRKLHNDVRLDDGTVLPQGMGIVIACPFIHMDKDMWGADADEFRPERFAEGVSQACKNPSAFMPFGSGPRICIGQQFALMEAKVTVALILQHFSFRLSPSYRHAPVGPFSLSPKHGVHLLLEVL
ncbi:hypothetical protein GOP47_0012849 [Adiantum capillus-veneris]|uniref:Cytochrome P450 n=1 Tax=Adiantum capillus-veneris TaxID=13818 RepID=A0A9D4ZEP9_ADICA|nr:hypothetical protein GOP47_0012849 [Adiantum capillus-veneris]